MDYKLVLVEWEDIIGGVRGGWKSIDSMKKDQPINCRSVGWIVSDNEHHMVIVPHIANDNDGDGEITIPRGCIRKLSILTVAKKK